jgi:hypothetical protein
MNKLFFNMCIICNTKLFTINMVNKNNTLKTLGDKIVNILRCFQSVYFIIFYFYPHNIQEHKYTCSITLKQF